MSTVTGPCGEGQPRRAQHLCSALLWGDPFVLSELESSLGWERETGKLRCVQEHISPPWRVQLGIKRSLGSHAWMPDVVFLSFRTLIVSQLVYFMALPVPVAKQLRMQWCWKEGGDRGGEECSAPGKWQEALRRYRAPCLNSTNTCTTHVVNTLPRLPAHVSLLKRSLLILLALLI